MKMTGIRRTALAVFGVAALASCSREVAEEAGPTRLTATVRRGDLIIRAEATGLIEPVRRVEVKSKASGEVLRLHIDVGDLVTRGTLLAEIDPRDVRNSFNQVQADLEVARARLEISEAQVERSRQLLAASVITQQEHENARLDYTNAQASLVRAETSFELAQLQLMDVSIRAPMDGTIIQKSVEEGVVIQSASQNVSGGTTLFVMADLADMQVRTLVDETDMGMLEAGLAAGVTVEAFPDRDFQGVIQKIEPQAVVEQNVTMFPVIVSIDNRSGLLKPGMNAEVVIQIDEARGVLLVPNNAVVQTQNVGPAALALGLDLERIDLTPFMPGGGAGSSGGRGGGGRAAGGGRQGGAGGGLAQAGGGQGSGAPADGAQRAGAGVGRAGGQATGEGLDRMQALGGRGASGDASGGARRAGGQAAPARQTRPAAVFVVGPNGEPQPRLVLLGIGDWDNTEIVSGVEADDVLVIVGAAQLQAQQQAFLEQMRERMGSSNPFGGGIPGGGRGFRGRE